tara:strand:- start:1412 stop:1849 length:438 start_codon:yes stop_codon:yes gene_type:complete
MSTKLSSSQTLVLIEILKILRNNENKIARKKIYELFIDKKLDDINSLDKQTILFIEKLNGDFDEIGFLVKEFNLKEILFKLYSDTIRRVWIALRSNIENEKIKRQKNDPTGITFGYFFSQLAYGAKKYRDENNLKEPGFTDLRKL